MNGREEQLTLIDYFVVAGYDSQTGLVVESSSEGTSSDMFPADSLRPPLQRSFVPKIIDYYPKKRRNCPFSPEIISLCMPKGLRFYTEKNVPQHFEFHTFANIREDGSRVNGTAITFYEEVRDTAVCAAMAALQQEHVREVTSGERNHSRDHVPPGTVSGGTHTLPRGRRNVNKRISYYDGGAQGALYMSKTLCLISRIPIVGATQNLLQGLYKVILSGLSSLPVESYIFWMLNEVPLPNAGTTLKVRFMDSVIVAQRPSTNELPFFDYSLSSLFQLLPIEKFLRIFTAFLLEHQILICSRELSKLMLVCESLCALAFPFRWQLTYVPILPSAQLKFVEAPVPYVMGISYEDSSPDFLFQSNICVLDVDSGRTEIAEDLPVFPQHRTLIAEIKSVLERFAEQASLDSFVRKDESGMRMSRSFDLVDDSPRMEHSPLDDLLQNNSALARVTAIARRAGVKVDSTLNTLRQELNEKSNCYDSLQCKQYFHDMRVNNRIREIVAARMTCTFCSYEQFVLGNALDREEDARDSLVVFDKAGFMADQPESHLPFLAAFLETQMFASFIDSKLLHTVTPDENVARFDDMIGEMKINEKELAIPSLTSPSINSNSEELLNGREEQLDYVVPPPHLLPSFSSITSSSYSYWPVLDSTALTIHESMSPMPSPWKQRYARLRPKTVETVRPLSSYGGAGIAGESPDQQNAKFVEQLLKETKGRTKRMLVEKLGKEAVELGHGEVLSGVEENTLVAALCDLLERIWAHGHVKKHGKSSLWSFILSHEDCHKLSISNSNSSTSYLAPGSITIPSPRPMHRTSSTTSSSSSSFNHFLPPPSPLTREPSRPSVRSQLGDLAGLLAGLEGESDGEDWKSSILRAANSLAEKLSSGLEMKNEEGRDGGGGVLSNAIGRFNEATSTVASNAIKKSSSVCDLTTPSRGSVDEERKNGRSDRRGGESKRDTSTEHRHRSGSRNRSPDSHYVIPQLPNSISYDLKNVLRMSEMKSDLGYARAFVRLALERRLLHRHLQTLLSNAALLSQTHKRYALIRQEEEREQFLMHIMSLNAASFRCFTNTFTKTKMEYQVVVVTGSWRGRIPPIWLIVEGSFCSTPTINLPTATPFFKFDHRNLGILSTVRIGHSSDKPSKWYLEDIVIRNEMTGIRYEFSCNRWFGKGVEDGSLERLLVARIVNNEDNNSQQNWNVLSSPAVRRGRRAHSRSQTPLRDRSPSTGRSSTTSGRMRAGEVEEFVGESINGLIRHLHVNTQGQNRTELAQLLCGNGGLLEAIESIFQCGRNEAWRTRLWGGVYPWDYIEKTAIWMHDVSRREEWRQLDRGQQEMIKQTLTLVHTISQNGQLGKEGRFQVFVLVSIRNHTLCGLIALMAWCPVTQQMYDSTSFLRNSLLLERFSKLLDSLFEYSFNIDSSLTYGII